MRSTGPPTATSGPGFSSPSRKNTRRELANLPFSIPNFDSSCKCSCLLVPPLVGTKLKNECSGYTRTVTEEQKTYGEKLLRTYHDWLYEHIMPPSADGYSASVMVLPWTNGEPDYRDTYRHGPQEFTGRGFFFYNVGPYAQCPELIVPGMYPNSLRRNYNPLDIFMSPLSLPWPPYVFFFSQSAPHPTSPSTREGWSSCLLPLASSRREGPMSCWRTLSATSSRLEGL